MKNITSIKLLNLYKGISTCQSRINKGLEGKALVYAKRYIKGAKTKIQKILKNLQKSVKIKSVNKKMKIYKKIKELATKMVKRVKMVMDKLLKNSDIINNVNKKDKKMVLPKDSMIKIANIDLDDEEIFENEINLTEKFSEWYE